MFTRAKGKIGATPPTEEEKVKKESAAKDETKELRRLSSVVSIATKTTLEALGLGKKHWKRVTIALLTLVILVGGPATYAYTTYGLPFNEPIVLSIRNGIALITQQGSYWFCVGTNPQLWTQPDLSQ